MQRKGIERILFVACHEYDMHVGLEFLETLGQRESVHARHLNIEKGYVHRLLLDMAQRIACVGKRQGSTTGMHGL